MRKVRRSLINLGHSTVVDRRRFLQQLVRSLAETLIYLRANPLRFGMSRVVGHDQGFLCGYQRSTNRQLAPLQHLHDGGRPERLYRDNRRRIVENNVFDVIDVICERYPALRAGGVVLNVKLEKARDIRSLISHHTDALFGVQPLATE